MIKTDKQYNAALDKIDKLESMDNPTNEQVSEIKRLIVVTERYEDDNFKQSEGA